jgi:hypothetical protein
VPEIYVIEGQLLGLKGFWSIKDLSLIDTGGWSWWFSGCEEKQAELYFYEISSNT